MRHFFTSLYRKILGYDCGQLHLTHGNHIVYVPTTISPNEVWVTIKGRGTDGCCQIPMNEIGYILKNRGIIFTIEVRTDCCLVEWFATR